jgi:bifunctional oligoribonuclease and PAP phosphatase NrnA
MTINWPAFIADIRAAKDIILTSHVRPDADALGSELGMARVLDVLGKRVRIVNGQATPPNLAFLDLEKRIQVIGQDVQIADLNDADLLMVLDTSAWAQLGPMGDAIKSLSCKKIVLDHHVGEDDLGATWYKNTSAEAAGRLVVEAAEQLGVKLTPEMAMPLFAAVATDTGWFRFGSANGYTYQIGTKLIDAGAKPAEIYKQLYEQETIGRVRLRGVILSRIELELAGRLAHTYALKDDFARLGALPSDTEDVINMALAIKGTEFAVIFVEQLAGGFKISFRSRSDVNCNTLAQQFGGGGHKAAAGAFVQGTLAEAQAQILGAVRKALGS